MLDLNTRDYGDIAPLVKAISGLTSAAWAVYFGFRGRNKAWEPPQQPLSSALSRVAAVAVAAGLAYVWYQLTDPAGAVALVKLLWPAVALTVVAFLVYGFLLTLLVHNRKFSNAPEVMSTEKVVGGFWKTKDAKNAQRNSKNHLPPDDLIWTMEGNPDLVWPKGSRGLAQLTLNLSYVLLTISGAALLTCGGAAVIAAQAPRIEVFTTIPSQVKLGDISTVTWRVVNAKSVSLDPIGDIPPFGYRAVRPDKDTAYTLTARNSFATTGVQQSVVVVPAQAVPARRQTATMVNPHPAGADVVVEARDCKLVENVVIRGGGWLQNEHDGTAEAECSVSLKNAGKYEIFVTYASPESRPVRVALNSRIIAENGIASPTGGTGEMNRLEQSLGVQVANQGINKLQFHSEHPFPYLQLIRFRPV
jgi:hypothetical protein